MRYLSGFLIMISATLASVANAQGGPDRLALVIANSDYNLDGSLSTPATFSTLQGFVNDLRNPQNDGRAMSAALTRLGFRVTLIENANRERMGTELALFGAQIDAASANAIVVIYYSGHAIQVDGQNYLIPAGARIPREQDMSRLPSPRAASFISTYAISANEILSQLRNPEAGGLNLVIFDACRNNPWQQRLYGQDRSLARRGLAELAPRLTRTLVAYSTASGDVASDGTEIPGSNSPYTRALLSWLPRPGYTVLQMLNNVGRDVLVSAGQVPWMNNAPLEDICLAGCPAAPGEAVAQRQTSARTAAPAELASFGPARSAREIEAARDAIARVTSHDWSLTPGAILIPRFLSEAPFSAYLSLAVSADPVAQWIVGQGYYDGVGIVRNTTEARRWLQSSADQGNARGQNGLAYLYTEEEVYGPARIWYLASARQGNAIGQVGVGSLYELGNGVSQNYAGALSWYRRAADQGSFQAQERIGLLYENGLGVPTDYAEAMSWYLRAAEQGDANGQYLVGRLYRYGRGVLTDYALSMEWYRRAAGNGLALAENEIGNLYREGLGVPSNPIEALSWYRRAVAHGSSVAMYNLGILLYDGASGVVPNQAEGLPQINRAAALGNERAREWLTGHGIILPPVVSPQ